MGVGGGVGGGGARRPGGGQPRSIFFALWSLAEAPLSARAPFERLARHFDAVLLGFHRAWGGVDNDAWVQVMCLHRFLPACATACLTVIGCHKACPCYCLPRPHWLPQGLPHPDTTVRGCSHGPLSSWSRSPRRSRACWHCPRKSLSTTVTGLQPPVLRPCPCVDYIYSNKHHHHHHVDRDTVRRVRVAGGPCAYRVRPGVPVKLLPYAHRVL